MASITINNSSITTTSNTVTINYTTDVTLSQVELTKDSSAWIKARTFSQNSASFDISSWTNGTYSNCKLRITYETVTNYGQIVLSTSTISLNEGSTGSFTVKLDSAPTSNQVVNLSVNNSNCSLNKSSLTFTPSNYNTTQSVTITGAHDSSSYSDKTSIITASSNGATSKTISVTIKNIDVPVTADPITLTLASSMSCNKGKTFNITYSTNVEATKHELSMNGGYSYFQIYPTSNGTTYTYSHEAINDTTWNPVYRTIRVTDANGNTATGTISIDIVESEPEIPTSYTITPQLTHCTCSNTATSITQGSSYSATISANSGYELSSITVTMGGANITSSAVSGSSISISNVTGNIVITATAVNISDTDANLVTTTRYATQGSVVLVSDRTYKITNTSVWDKLGLCGDITEVPAGNYNVCIKVMEKNVAPDTIATLTLETTFAMTHETTLEADLKTYDLDTVYKKPITVYNHNKIGNEALLAFIQFNASNTGENITVKLWLE